MNTGFVLIAGGINVFETAVEMLEIVKDRFKVVLECFFDWPQNFYISLFEQLLGKSNSSGIFLRFSNLLHDG